jgi:hypothetical protein
MAIPASVGLYTNWVHGTITNSGSDDYYTQASPEIPNGYVVLVKDSNVEVESASPWSGQTLLDCANHWYDGAYWSGLTSAEITATQGRLLIEVDTFGSANNGKLVMHLEATDNTNFRIRVWRNAGSPDYMRVFLQWNGNGSEADVVFSAFPSNPFNLEFLWDTNNSTANQRLRARYWEIGSSVPSFTDATATTGTAGTTDQPTKIFIAEYENDTVTARYGRLIVSDDITEDLSAVSEGGADLYAFQ